MLKKEKLTIVADENIPYLDHFFGELGNIVRLPGRSISAKDLDSADILLTRSVTKVNADLLANTPVKFVGSCTIGTDHLAVEALAIDWANAPGCNAPSVVQYVLSAVASQLPGWRSKKVGVIGGGNVGGLVVKVMQQLGVDCCCYDPLIDQAPSYLCSLEQVLSCDIVTCHTPLTTSGPFPSHNMLDEAALKQLAPNSLLISAGRGGVINEPALMAVMSEKNLKVVLDVWQNEPAINPELVAAVDVATPHIAGYSLDGKITGTFMVYRALCEFLQCEAVVKMPELEPVLLNISSAPALNDYLLGAYDIARDSEQLKQCAANAVVAQEFDPLRKHYPMRRDYSGYNVSLESVHPDWVFLQCL